MFWKIYCWFYISVALNGFIVMLPYLISWSFADFSSVAEITFLSLATFAVAYKRGIFPTNVWRLCLVYLVTLWAIQTLISFGALPSISFLQSNIFRLDGFWLSLISILVLVPPMIAMYELAFSNGKTEEPLPLPKYLPYLIVIFTAFSILISVPTSNIQKFIPCSYIDTTGVDWSKLTEREKDCRTQQYSVADEKRRELGRIAEQESKNWPEYRDEELGVAIRYPENSNAGKIVFIRAGNILFIRTESSDLYARRNELPQQDDAAIIQMVKQIEDDNLPAWAIRVYDVSGETDLQKIVDSWYGEDRCLISGMGTTTFDGVFNLGLSDKYPSTDGYINDQGSCWINWVSPRKYSPSQHRAAIWDIGQDARIGYRDCYDLICSADFPMADSFRFIERKLK